MHSFIVEGGDRESRSLYIQDLLKAPTELIHLVAEKTSLTIKQIQDLAGALSISARLPRIVWIEEANLLTVPAQNALLKMLEEPPESTSFYLTLNSATSPLPTIRSRCSLINLPNTPNLPNSANILSDLKQIMSLSPGDRLIAIVKRDRSESILWITEIESALKAKLADRSVSKAGARTLAKIARLALQAHTEFLANCSVGLVTQNFYLRLPHVLQ
jgi:DNA polymerase III delta prime subunit